MVIRPSKQFLFDYLASHLRDIRSGTGIDAASANFKNRPMFQTEKYLGIDIDEESLRDGLARYQADPRVSGLRADLHDLSALPQASGAAVVSTNTLHQLSIADRIRAVKELARLVSPRGMLFLELPADMALDAIVRYLRGEFQSVRVRFYKNPVSRGYEQIFERGGELGSHPVAGTRVLRLLSWLLSRLEYLTCGFSTGNRHAIIVCWRK